MVRLAVAVGRAAGPTPPHPTPVARPTAAPKARTKVARRRRRRRRSRRRRRQSLTQAGKAGDFGNVPSARRSYQFWGDTVAPLRTRAFPPSVPPARPPTRPRPQERIYDGVVCRGTRGY